MTPISEALKHVIGLSNFTSDLTNAIREEQGFESLTFEWLLMNIRKTGNLTPWKVSYYINNITSVIELKNDTGWYKFNLPTTKLDPSPKCFPVYFRFGVEPEIRTQLITHSEPSSYRWHQVV